MEKKTKTSLKKKFYVTTPIYYPNDIPHIGHAYTTVAADILSRWHKLLGEDVFFLTGTDEHGKKLEKTALAKGKKPKEFIDALIPEFKSAWKKLNVEYDYFIRTTDKAHEKVIQEVLQKCFDNGDIYLGSYKGLYCVGCETYYTEKDLIEGCCPIHKKPVETLNEASYFFKLSKYQDKLLKFYKDNPKFILPEERASQVINSVKEGLQDLSISRTSFDWGIPLPFDKKHICFVWFDALFNYYSATREKGKSKYWPADVHLVGKDIIWFHTVYWPAFLMSVGLDLPKSVFAHGWWTFDKEKISKSVGKVINVDELISIAGVDSARYFLFRNTAFGQDGDFSEKALVERHNNELANKLGNLVSRVSALVEKYGLIKCENKLLKKLNLKKIETHFENYEIDKALNEIFSFIDKTNEYVQETEPWKTGDKKALYELSDSIKAIAILLSPFMPKTCEDISKVFNFKIDYKEISKPLKVSKIKKADILFTKIEVEEKPVETKLNKPVEPKKIEGIATMADMIKYDDFAKLDLRVGTIKNVEDLEGADKLWKLTVDLGSEIGQRTILAGIKKYYSKEQLTEKQIIVIVNLEPRKMKGSESQGMLLAAGTAGSDTCILISPEKNVENGTKIG
jgi:methionyl-tRNA synthetase